MDNSNKSNRPQGDVYGQTVDPLTRICKGVVKLVLYVVIGWVILFAGGLWLLAEVVQYGNSQHPQVRNDAQCPHGSYYNPGYPVQCR